MGVPEPPEEVVAEVTCDVGLSGMKILIGDVKSPVFIGFGVSGAERPGNESAAGINIRTASDLIIVQYVGDLLLKVSKPEKGEVEKVFSMLPNSGKSREGCPSAVGISSEAWNCGQSSGGKFHGNARIS